LVKGDDGGFPVAAGFADDVLRDGAVYEELLSAEPVDGGAIGSGDEGRGLAGLGEFLDKGAQGDGVFETRVRLELERGDLAFEIDDFGAGRGDLAAEDEGVTGIGADAGLATDG
jgi:hypothetical protein